MYKYYKYIRIYVIYIMYNKDWTAISVDVNVKNHSNEM